MPRRIEFILRFTCQDEGLIGWHLWCLCPALKSSPDLSVLAAPVDLPATVLSLQRIARRVDGFGDRFSDFG